MDFLSHLGDIENLVLFSPKSIEISCIYTRKNKKKNVFKIKKRRQNMLEKKLGT
jgi:hypothetical protein